MPAHRPLRSLVIAALLACGGFGLVSQPTRVRAADAVAHKPSVVRVVKTDAGWELQRNGAPYLIKGAGGQSHLDLLAACGGNSIRTWGADDLGPLLDEAQRRGLTVTVGIWLGHPDQGFDYSSADQVAAQYERAREAILRYKDHPALLMWGIGNEMEGYGKGDNGAVWSAVNNIAALAKRLDADHPTMSVVAEIGGDRVKNLHRLCPDVDVVGINSYGGGPSIPKRYAEAGGTKPYVMTEFGPPGVWETGKNGWGAAPELTSTQKGALYRKTWDEAVAAQKGKSLGGYAFTWGSKQEATATWFGMFLPDGSKLGAVDAMAEAWSGKPPANRCPTIDSLKLEGDGQVDPGGALKASLDASDPEGAPLAVRWVVQPEADRYAVGGQNEAKLPTFPEAIVRSDNRGAEVRAAKEPGGYRLFAYVSDGKGSAAVGNLPFLVKGQVKPPDGLEAKLPLVLYDEASRQNLPFTPSGYMGSVKAIKVDEACMERPHAGKSCLRCDYTAAGEWGGVVWQSPANDWGDRAGGWKLTGAKRLAFWARGEKGGETVAFQYGLLGRDKKFFDTASGKLEGVKLTPDWKEYSLDLSGKDLSRLKTGFAWVVAGQGAPLTFYLDDLRYE